MQFRRDSQTFFIDVEFLVMMAVGSIFAALRAGLEMDVEDMVDAVDIAAANELARSGTDFFRRLEGELDRTGKFILMSLQDFQRA